MRPVLTRLLALAALAPALLTLGCGEADGVTVVRIWHQKDSAERRFLEEVAQRYNAAHDSVRVEVLWKETEELRNHYVFAAVGGKGPDLIYGPGDNVGTLGITETIRPLDDLVSAEYLAAFTDEGTLEWEGKTVFVADQVGNHLTLVRNTALWPEAPATLQDLVEQAQRHTVDRNGDGKPEQYGLIWNYTEPFFFIPFLTAYGGWVMDDAGNPTLDTPATVRALQFILDLRDKHRVIPRESDYNVSETLFKEGRAAAVINGPWAWAGYGDAGVDYEVTPLPFNTETGLWAAPTVAAKGYSVNPAVPDEKLPAVLDVLAYLTSAPMQREMAERLATIPTLRAVRESEVMDGNPVLRGSLEAAERGRMMPTAPQMRQIWDAMRGPYQLVMNGAVSAEEGARLMQLNAEKRIADTFL